MCIKPQFINDFGGLTLDYKIIEVKQSIFEDNDADAERLRQEIKEDNTFLINLMSYY